MRCAESLYFLLARRSAESGVTSKPKAIVFFLFKALITGVLLWWLSRYFDYQQVRESLRGIDPGLLVFAVLLHVLSYLAGAVRWWLLFRHLAGPVSLARIMPSYYLGVFFNNVLPSAYGGDVARSARLYISGMSGSALIGSAVVDRVLGLVSVVMMGGMAVIAMPQVLDGRHTLWLLAAMFAALVLGLYLLPGLIRITDRLLGGRWPRVQELLSCFLRYQSSPRLLLGALGLSFLNQALVLVVFLMLAHAVGIDVPMLQFVAMLMLVFLVASLPISLGGLGPREGAMMALLLPLGVESSLVLTLSISYLFVLWCAAMPGALVLVFRAGKDEKSEPRPA